MSSKMPSSKAKVGDTILVNTYEGRSNTAKRNPGRMLRVTAVRDGYVNTDYDCCFGIWNDEYNVVTIAEPKAESELERLVRVANEGRTAEEALYKFHASQVDQLDRRQGFGWEPLSDPGWCSEFRIKPKAPAFEPFRVGTATKTDLGWLVKLEGDILHVGCRKFLSSYAKQTLLSLCKDNRAAGCHLDATPVRDGILYDDHKISWADADKILNALEKAGVK